MTTFMPPFDLAAIGFFFVSWIGYGFFGESQQRKRQGLNARIHAYREVWIRRAMSREARMVDMQVMGALQNGTAFFASTTLLAIGGALTLMRSTGEVMNVMQNLPIGPSTTPAQ